MESPFGYERVYLPLHKVADTPFHIQGDQVFLQEENSDKIPRTILQKLTALSLVYFNIHKTWNVRLYYVMASFVSLTEYNTRTQHSGVSIRIKVAVGKEKIGYGRYLRDAHAKRHRRYNAA